MIHYFYAKYQTSIMIRKTTLLISLFLIASYASAQIYDPVSWDFGYEKKGENQYELIFTASIEENSHIYSMDVPVGGPIPTSFHFDSLQGIKLEGATFEVTKPSEMLDEAFGFKIKTFSTKAEFRQKITTSGTTFTATGAVNFMACNNATCSPPKDVEFSISNTDKNSSQITQVAEKPELGQPAPGRGLLKFFLISLLAGFAGVLTPCVFSYDSHDSCVFLKRIRKQEQVSLQSTNLWHFNCSDLFFSWNYCFTYKRRCRICKHSEHSLDTQFTILYIICGICRFFLRGI